METKTSHWDQVKMVFIYLILAFVARVCPETPDGEELIKVLGTLKVIKEMK